MLVESIDRITSPPETRNYTYGYAEDLLFGSDHQNVFDIMRQED